MDFYFVWPHHNLKSPQAFHKNVLQKISISYVFSLMLTHATFDPQNNESFANNCNLKFAFDEFALFSTKGTHVQTFKYACTQNY